MIERGKCVKKVWFKGREKKNEKIIIRGWKKRDNGEVDEWN
jgi:hypothetical protein